MLYTARMEEKVGQESAYTAAIPVAIPMTLGETAVLVEVTRWES